MLSFRIPILEPLSNTHQGQYPRLEMDAGRDGMRDPENGE